MNPGQFVKSFQAVSFQYESIIKRIIKIIEKGVNEINDQCKRIKEEYFKNIEGRF